MDKDAFGLVVKSVVDPVAAMRYPSACELSVFS